MKRPWLWLLAAGLAAGCQGSPPTSNPFRTTVAPPATGQGAPPTGAAPYYQNAPGSPPGGAATSPGGPATSPANSVPPVGAKSPPGRFSQSKSDEADDVIERASRASFAKKDGAEQPASADRPSAEDLAAVDDVPTLGRPDEGAVEMRRSAAMREASAKRPAASPMTRSTKPTALRRDEVPALAEPARRTGNAAGRLLAATAGRDTVTQPETSGPAADADSSANADAPVAASQSPGTAKATSIRIVEGSGAAVARADSTDQAVAVSARIGVVADDTAVKTASANEKPTAVTRGAADAIVSDRAAAGDARRVYDHDPDYRWVRGKLEYSRTSRQWKLRYIPIDGQTDGYGGSVVLPEGSVGTDFAAGDLVQVRGKIEGTGSPRSFSPKYSVEQLEYQNR